MTAPDVIETLDRFCVYGIADDYDALVEYCRYRRDELQTTHESIDDVSGLHGGYSGKILAPVPIKSMGKVSLGPMLQTLGLALIVVRDDEAFKKVRARLAKRKRTAVSPTNAGKLRPTWLFTRRKARQMGKRRFALMSPAKLKRHQRKAQKASAAARRRKAIAAPAIQPATV